MPSYENKIKDQALFKDEAETNELSASFVKLRIMS
jgi:hypothetical protein